MIQKNKRFFSWLVVLTILKNDGVRQWEGLSHILWKIIQMFETTLLVVGLYDLIWYIYIEWYNCDYYNYIPYYIY